MNSKSPALRVATALLPKPERLRSLVRAAVRRTGLERPLKALIAQQVRAELQEGLRAELSERMARDLDLESTRRHLEDLVVLLDARVERVVRELDRAEQPAFTFEAGKVTAVARKREKAVEPRT
jgi:ribosomal 50S subunit-associated protein YjgA (DUF615 family)